MTDLEAGHVDGCLRDPSMFGDGISIEDDMAVMVRYRSRATMTCHLTACSPWEGCRVMFNGSKGPVRRRAARGRRPVGSLSRLISDAAL